MKWTLIIGLVSALTLAGCGGDGICREGDVCPCEEQGTCSWECRGGDCAFSVTGQGTATLTCPDGGCTVSATGQGDVNLSCAGGSCSVDCNGQGTCSITSCPDCVCTEGGITADCSVQ